MTGDITQKHMVSPFEGEPYTFSKTDEHGNPAMEVTINEMTPERVPWADGLAGICILAIVALNFYILKEMEASHFLVWAGGLIGPFFAHPWIAEVIYKIMAKETLVLFTPTEFRVRTEESWLVYDRTLTHRFVMLIHDRAREERERHEVEIRRAQRRGQDIQPKRIYGDSFHIIFEYLGQRFDVATVYNQRRATAVAARLKAVDKVMDTKNQIGEGEALNPSEQWGNAPGRLPDV